MQPNGVEVKSEVEDPYLSSCLHASEETSLYAVRMLTISGASVVRLSARLLPSSSPEEHAWWAAHASAAACSIMRRHMLRSLCSASAATLQATEKRDQVNISIMSYFRVSKIKVNYMLSPHLEMSSCCEEFPTGCRMQRVSASISNAPPSASWRAAAGNKVRVALSE